MSTQLEEVDKINFKVNTETGECFASFRVGGKLFGVDHETVRRYCKNAPDNYDTSQGLTPEMLSECAAHFAKKGKAEAVETLASLASAGAKAFIYTKAGFTLQVAPKIPTALEAARAAVQAGKETVLALEAVERLTIQVDADAIMTAKSDVYHPISHVKKLNPGKGFSGVKLRIVSEELDLPIKQLFGNYESGQTNTYHVDAWNSAYPGSKL